MEPEIFSTDLLFLFVLLQHFQGQQQLQAILALLSTMCATMHITFITLAFFSNPGYRQFWGIPSVKRFGEPFIETVERMMKPPEEGGKPSQFYGLFRMYPATFEWFCTFMWAWVRDRRDAERIAQGVNVSSGRPRDYRVFRTLLMMTIFFLAHGVSLVILGVIWDMPNVKSDYLLIKEIASTRDYFIRWPTGQLLYDAMASFSQLLSRHRDQEFGFSRCIGAIDGSFCRILRPGAYSLDGGIEHNSYKKYYAIQILVVCLPNLMFTYAHVGTPGSRADTTMLKNCDLYLRINDYIPPGSGAFLLGDGGFSLLLWLLTPFENSAYRALNFFRRLIVTVYDAAQKSARVTIEQSLGVLKGRWRILHLGIHLHLPLAPYTVDACIVLHNVCIARGDIWTPSVNGESDFTDPDRGFTLPDVATFVHGQAAARTIDDLHATNSAAAKQFRNSVAEGLAPSLVRRRAEAAADLQRAHADEQD